MPTVKFQVSQSVLYDQLKNTDIHNKHYSPGKSGQIEHGLMVMSGIDVRPVKVREYEAKKKVLDLGKRYGKVPNHVTDPNSVELTNDPINYSVNVRVEWDDEDKV